MAHGHLEGHLKDLEMVESLKDRILVWASPLKDRILVGVSLDVSQTL